MTGLVEAATGSGAGGGAATGTSFTGGVGGVGNACFG